MNKTKIKEKEVIREGQKEITKYDGKYKNIGNFIKYKWIRVSNKRQKYQNGF